MQVGLFWHIGRSPLSQNGGLYSVSRELRVLLLRFHCLVFACACARMKSYCGLCLVIQVGLFCHISRSPLAYNEEDIAHFGAYIWNAG